MSRGLTDARRMWVMLRDAGAAGVHSHELRRAGISGNPSQRAKDIADHGVAVATRRENVGRRPGARYWLGEHAPSDAHPVRPNRDADVGGESDPVHPPGTPLAADVSARWGWVRDYTDPDGCWRREPVAA